MDELRTPRLLSRPWRPLRLRAVGRRVRGAGVAGPVPRLRGPGARASFLAAAGEASELGWRLDPAVWGRGLATEAAVAALDDAFTRLELPEVISVIHPDDVRSQRVAEKLGMVRWRTIENPVLGIDVDVWRLEAPAR